MRQRERRKEVAITIMHKKKRAKIIAATTPPEQRKGNGIEARKGSIMTEEEKGGETNSNY